MIINKDSDEEDQAEDAGVDQQIIETLSCLVPKIKDCLLDNCEHTQPAQYTATGMKPLGLDRIRAIELLYQIVRLNKPAIHMALSETQILTVLFDLV